MSELERGSNPRCSAPEYSWSFMFSLYITCIRPCINAYTLNEYIRDNNCHKFLPPVGCKVRQLPRESKFSTFISVNEWMNEWMRMQVLPHGRNLLGSLHTLFCGVVLIWTHLTLLVLSTLLKCNWSYLPFSFSTDTLNNWSSCFLGLNSWLRLKLQKNDIKFELLCGQLLIIFALSSIRFV